jgi:hypothetical protein
VPHSDMNKTVSPTNKRVVKQRYLRIGAAYTTDYERRLTIYQNRTIIIGITTNFNLNSQKGDRLIVSTTPAHCSDTL